tara:strand:- start:82 stop:297 length:216 start_codon:yes stop_codon:yes gene_type:complete
MKDTNKRYILRDITEYSDNELAMQVMNDEHFYIELANPKFVLALVDEEFIYTDKQKEILIDTMREDYEDYN